MVSSATISEPIRTFTDLMVSVLVSLSSPVASEDGDEDFVGLEGPVTTNNDFDFEGAPFTWPNYKGIGRRLG